MGSLERRLEAIEECFREGRPDANELHLRVLVESLRRLSVVEMHVLEELREANATRGEQSRADLWHHLSAAQRCMEHEWSRAVQRAWRDAIEPDESIDAREKERLRMETLNAVIGYPLRSRSEQEEYEENRRREQV